jgi:hypothetical protein
MLQGASEGHITGRTHISYRLSEFKRCVVSTEDAGSAGHSSESKTNENDE